MKINIKMNWNIFEWVTIVFFYIGMIWADFRVLDSGIRIVEVKEYYITIVITVLFLLIPKTEKFMRHVLSKNAILKILVVIFSYI